MSGFSCYVFALFVRGTGQYALQQYLHNLVAVALRLPGKIHICQMRQHATCLKVIDIGGNQQYSQRGWVNIASQFTAALAETDHFHELGEVTAKYLLPSSWPRVSPSSSKSRKIRREICSRCKMLCRCCRQKWLRCSMKLPSAFCSTSIRLVNFRRKVAALTSRKMGQGRSCDPVQYPNDQLSRQSDKPAAEPLIAD